MLVDIRASKWHHVCIAHSYRRIVSSRFECFVDGIKVLKTNFGYPNTSEMHTVDEISLGVFPAKTRLVTSPKESFFSRLFRSSQGNQVEEWNETKMRNYNLEIGGFVMLAMTVSEDDSWVLFELQKGPLALLHSPPLPYVQVTQQDIFEKQARFTSHVLFSLHPLNTHRLDEFTHFNRDSNPVTDEKQCPLSDSESFLVIDDGPFGLTAKFNAEQSLRCGTVINYSGKDVISCLNGFHTLLPLLVPSNISVSLSHYTLHQRSHPTIRITIPALTHQPLQPVEIAQALMLIASLTSKSAAFLESLRQFHAIPMISSLFEVYPR